MQILSIIFFQSRCCYPAYHIVFVTGLAALSLPPLSALPALSPRSQLLRLLVAQMGERPARLDPKQAAHCLPPTFILLRALPSVPTFPALSWSEMNPLAQGRGER